MMNKAILLGHNIDYDKGLKRFLDDAELYEEMLAEFCTDDSFKKAAAAFDACDYTELFAQAHAIKGVAGNLDMTALYRAAGELTELLRNNDSPDHDRVCACFDALKTAYRCVIEGIQAAG